MKRGADSRELVALRFPNDRDGAWDADEPHRAVWLASEQR
jgi:hypothetical protein